MKAIMSKFCHLLSLSLVLLVPISLLACQSAYGTNPNPVPTPTAAPAPVAGSSAAVTVSNFAFSPATITVKAGTTVTWTNKDGAAHTVTSDTAGVFDSRNLATNATFSYAFGKAGTFTYYCAIHPSMKGTVIVQ